MECKSHLNNLGRNNSVDIFWIPGHEGNEAADDLARQGSATDPFSPSPFLPLAWSSSRQLVNEWLLKETARYRKAAKGLRQSRLLINPAIHKNLTLLPRESIRLVVGFLTGFFKTRSHLVMIRKAQVSTCRLCISEEVTFEETTEHLLFKCSTLSSIRYQCLGAPECNPRIINLTPPGRLAFFLKKVVHMLGRTT